MNITDNPKSLRVGSLSLNVCGPKQSVVVKALRRQFMSHIHYLHTFTRRTFQEHLCQKADFDTAQKHIIFKILNRQSKILPILHNYLQKYYPHSESKELVSDLLKVTYAKMCNFMAEALVLHQGEKCTSYWIDKFDHFLETMGKTASGIFLVQLKIPEVEHKSNELRHKLFGILDIEDTQRLEELDAMATRLGGMQLSLYD